MMKQLIINKPEDPVKFLLDELKKPEIKRIVIMGPPGSKRKVHALSLGEYYGYQTISVGDLLNKEISKKSEYGKQVMDSRKEYSYISDNVVIDLVQKQI